MRATLARAVAFIFAFTLKTRLRIFLTVIAATLFFGLFEFAVSRWLLAIHLSPNLHCCVQSAIVALGSGAALWLILLGMAERRKIAEDELCRCAELNHTLRNALEVIVLAHYSGTDPRHKAMILESTNRIDQKLKELYPVLGAYGVRLRVRDGKWTVTEGFPGRTRDPR